MKYKKYKPGDRIFYECIYDNSIHTDIVQKVTERTYQDERGKSISYQELMVDDLSFIENHSCLPLNDPRVKELMKKYKAFDKAKPSIIKSIQDLLAPWDIELKKQILKEIEVSYEQ